MSRMQARISLTPRRPAEENVTPPLSFLSRGGGGGCGVASAPCRRRQIVSAHPTGASAWSKLRTCVPFRFLTRPPDLACATATHGHRCAATPHRLPVVCPAHPPPLVAPRRFHVHATRRARAISAGRWSGRPAGPTDGPPPVSAAPRPHRDRCRAAASGVRAVDPPAAGQSPVPFPSSPAVTVRLCRPWRPPRTWWQVSPAVVTAVVTAVGCYPHVRHACWCG